MRWMPAQPYLALTTLLLYVLPFWAGTSWAGLTPEEVQETFGEANYLFRQANDAVGDDPEKARELYRKSAMRFERLARDGGIHNGKLYYNIGNAYFRMEDLGRAVLNYRRALETMPNDVNLQQNLACARAKCLDRIEVEQKTRVLETLFFWHYDIPGKVRSVAFAVCFVLTWLLAGARIFVRSTTLGWLLSLSMLLTLAFLGSLVTDTVQRQRERPGVVIGDQVVARQGDSETYEKSFTEPLHTGTEFALLESRHDWCHIQLADGRQCWVPADGVELVR